MPKPGIGIVHLGLGAFFRAHAAIYVAEAMQRSGGDWAILGVSLQSSAIRDALAPQGFRYRAVEQGPAGEVAREIDVIRDVLVAQEAPAAVLTAMADRMVRIVSLTVTEKGYCHAPATGRLNFEHPHIAHDLTSPLPRSAIGFLTRALGLRRDAGMPPFTVLTCDNLPENGRLLRGLVLEFAGRIDADLAAWIATEGRFPCSMVDRIVPATKPEDIARLTEMTGVADAAPVMHEPFRQWVIEDDFVGDARPDLGAVGVELVRDVAPYEMMKLRLLNGSHSALAYLGYLAGHATIAETVADPVFAGYAEALWRDEIIPTLTPPVGQDLIGYTRQLLDRYRNPAIRHRTWQIAMDGSQKLPQRILGTLADNLAAGRASPGLMLAIAGWMRYVGGVDEAGHPIEVKDPLADRLLDLSALGVTGLLSVPEIFPRSLAPLIARGVTEAYDQLVTLGARGAVAALTGGQATCPAAQPDDQAH
jgi:fructuronate reductase